MKEQRLMSNFDLSDVRFDFIIIDYNNTGKS